MRGVGKQCGCFGLAARVLRENAHFRWKRVHKQHAIKLRA
jgi:hypothetical protein